MNRIRELRKYNKMTQKELAKQLQIADSTLSYWEMEKFEPGNKSLQKLSNLFKVPIDYILGGDLSEWEQSDTNGLNSIQIAFRRSEFEGLTQSEVDKLAEYAEFIKAQRKKRKSGD